MCTSVFVSVSEKSEEECVCARMCACVFSVTWICLCLYNQGCWRYVTDIGGEG